MRIPNPWKREEEADDLWDEPELDPEDERFLQSVENATGAFLRGLAVGFPVWLALLALMLVVFNGPSIVGFVIATAGATALVLWLERLRGNRVRVKPSQRAVIIGLALVLALVLWAVFVSAAGNS